MTRSIDTTSARGPRHRLRDLTAKQWLLLAETFFLLASASVAIWILPFRLVVRFASRPVSRRIGRLTPGGGIEELCWAIEAVAWRVPWRTVCFQKGLALQAMLRSRGTPSTLHYGVGKAFDGALKAHVWISVDGHVVQGGDAVDRHHCLATYTTER